MIGWWRNRTEDSPPAQSDLPGDPLFSIPEGVRIAAIGDIHGCEDLLQRVHAAIDILDRSSPAQRSIEVVLGDMIDRGPNTRGVIDRLIARSQAKEVIILSGNHEAMMLRFLDHPDTLMHWLGNGGIETLRSYQITPRLPLDANGMAALANRLVADMPAEHILFLRGLRSYWSFHGLTFVHAGIRPGIAIERQARRDLLEIRAPFLNHVEPFGTFVVHGHTPNADVEIRHNRLNLDTGAFATGRLSAAVFEHGSLQIMRAVRGT